jgi:predicted Zn finger-like uncharacterized protein
MAGYSSEPSTSLATACPSCATVFRVVQDQLKVSQGWVRCGRCHEVFNALEGLFDLDSRRGGETGSASGFSNTGPTSQSGAAATPGSAAQRGITGTTSGPATPQDGWDETSPAMFSGNRSPGAGRSQAEAPGAGAALLRERLAARVAAANAAAGGHPGGAHDEVEQDTRFEPKFFENGPPTPLPDDVSAPGQSPARPGDVGGGDRAADRSTATRAGANSADVDVDMDLSAGGLGELEQRREPWLISGTAGNRPAASPAPVNERGNQRWAEAMGEEADESQPEFSPTEALLQLPDGPLMPVREPARAAGREGVMASDDWAAEAAMSRVAAGVSDTVHQPASAAGPMTLPGFLRDAERKARWQRPWVRWVLLVLCVVLLLGALAQLGLKNRDRYAARWPVTRPLLLELCGLVGCTLQAPRQIDALVVETSSLTRPPGVEGLRLQLVLRNRIDYEVAAPHVELSLTDAAGAVMARRVFTPADFGATRPALGAQQDANWSLVFSTTLRNIAGYSVSVFYP